MTQIVIAYSRPEYQALAAGLAEKHPDVSFHVMTSPDRLTAEALHEIAPRYVFFPHWSHLLSKEIYERFCCVMFHMTDLPFGRGGSPLQNLIARGIYETKMSAFLCADGIDTGAVLLKKDFSVKTGTAAEIFERAAVLIEQMIDEIIRENPEPVPQSGEPTTFRRRKPRQSNLENASTLIQAYDYIRMLDAVGYPSAFLETDSLRFEFTDVVDEHAGEEITAKVTIKRKST